MTPSTSKRDSADISFAQKMTRRGGIFCWVLGNMLFYKELNQMISIESHSQCYATETKLQQEDMRLIIASYAHFQLHVY